MKVFFLGAALVLLDVFPGSCVNRPVRPPVTTAGACQSTCDCDQTLAAPIKCPGKWECNADRLCEYSCKNPCTDTGGCEAPGEVCIGSTCSAPVACP
jgi:hypothetical protein